MQQLQKEFSYQQKKHQITSIEKQHWKLLRIRPASFPTLRLVQLAGLVFQSSHLFSKILESTKISDLKNYSKQIAMIIGTRIIFLIKSNTA